MDLTQFADVCGTDKGTHQGFMKHYPRYLPHDRKMVSLVELGVQHGGSLHMWHKHFKNPFSTIIGVDIDLSQANTEYAAMWQGYALRTLEGTDNKVLTVEGDQADGQLAAAVHNYAGDLDIVIDDASHFSSKTIGSFGVWWPFVQQGGLYVIEDTHCSYNVDHYGEREAAPPLEMPSPRSPRHPRLGVATTMEFLKRLADDVNWNYHGYDRFNPIYDDIAFVHFYPGITFIGKKES